MIDLTHLGITVSKDTEIHSAAYPLALELRTAGTVGEAGRQRRILSLQEARTLIGLLLETIAEIEAEDGYVQVELGPYGSVYTYADPTGEARPGDQVTVSGAGRFAVGTVVGRGRGTYAGPVYEEITGKVVPLS